MRIWQRSMDDPHLRAVAICAAALYVSEATRNAKKSKNIKSERNVETLGDHLFDDPAGTYLLYHK